MASIQHVVIDHAVTTAQSIATRGKVHRLPDETAVVADYVSTTGALTDDTAVSGIIGQHIRAQIVTTGTYSGGANMNVWVRIENGNN